MKPYILITGASRGIGRAIAYEFASHHHNILAISRSHTDLLEELQESVREFPIQCLIRQCDVSSYEEVLALKTFLKEQHIFIEAVINNAGIAHFGLLQDMSVEEWHTILHTNLSSVFYTSKCFLDDMIREGHGRIINISSVWGNVGASCEVAYSATKGSINSFTKALAKELAPSHIPVNAIACGAVDTEMNGRLSADERQELEDEIPYGRMATPKEVAELTYHVYQSPSYLTGQIITIDGGWM